jgi:hypothetical protein
LCNNLAVTGSHLPGTTLQAVRIPCFSSDRHALWDTPGIINRKAVQYSLFPVHIMEPMARPEPIPMPSREAGTEGQWRPGYSVLIEAAWMDDPDPPVEEVVRDLIKEQDEVNKEMNAAPKEPEVPKVVTAKVEEINEEKEEDAEEENNGEEDEEDKEDEDEEDKEEDHEDDDDDDDEEEEEKDHDGDDDDDDDDDTDEVEKESDNDDSDDDDLQMNRKKAALEKRKKVIAAAKERRRLRLEKEAAKKQTKDNGKDKKSSAETHKPPKDYRGPCVLGRIDLISVEHGHAIFAQAYVHPALRIRIVPTSEAPDHATVPTKYLNVIRKRMQEAAGQKGAVATKLKTEYSIPLKAYIGGSMKNGELIPGPKEFKENYQTYFMDVVFASLGWISISHRGSFTLLPYCIEGSVYSKRPSLYPTNLASQLETDGPEDDPFHGMTEDEVSDRLKQAARMGRHAGGGISPPGEYSRGNVRASHGDDGSDNYSFHQDGHDMDEEDSMWY